jgi:ribosomal protein L21
MKSNYQVTIGYKAVITVDITAGSEEEAKKKAIEIMKAQRDKMYKKHGFDLQGDTLELITV